MVFSVCCYSVTRKREKKSKTQSINGFIGDRLRFVCSLVFVAFKKNSVFFYLSVLKWNRPIIFRQSLNWKCTYLHWFNWKWLQITLPRVFSISSQTFSVWLQVCWLILQMWSSICPFDVEFVFLFCSFSISVILCMVQKVPQIRDLFVYKSAKGKFYRWASRVRVIQQKGHNVIFYRYQHHFVTTRII